MTRLNLGSGPYRIENFDNLDKLYGWTFESGLGRYRDNAVEGVTVCHALMFVKIKDWPDVFDELARVLEPGGVLRVQEDDTGNPASARHGGHEEAVTLTTPEMVARHMEAAGLTVRHMDFNSTTFRDKTLIQRLHRPEPHSFAVEGTKW